MTFDPNTIEHLGVRMYSTLPPVLAELVANSYDANADTVSIVLNDNGEKKGIIVEDNGDGMSFTDINEKFLRIGRNRREDTQEEGTRKVIGKKGLGKLSFFGIANEIEVTTRKDGKENTFLLRWEDIKRSPTPNYQPTILKNNLDCSKELKGTTITLKEIKRESDFSAESIADSLSKIFIVEEDFKILVQHNKEDPIKIENSRRYDGLDKEIEWEVPSEIGLTSDYDKREKVVGHLIATKKPISPKTNMRGIILFSRKKMVNLPEYFSDSTSSHFFSYLTGLLEIDFIDELSEDVISTDRQSVNWGHPEMVKLRVYLQSMIRWLEQDWRMKRTAIREEEIKEKTGVNIPDWYSKLPADLREQIRPVINAIVKEAELDGNTGSAVVRNVHAIIPEYPHYHWRHLHDEIKSIAEDDYMNNRYFDATEKASRLYMQRVKEKSGIDSGKDDNDMDSAFNPGTGALMVTACADPTEKNIQNGQQLLSKGVVAGCRNPLAHNPEYQKKLVDTGLFTEKDCLDMLSIISHLFGRLEKAQPRPVSVTPQSVTV